MGRLIDVERVLEPYKILRNTDTLCVATIRQNILECPTVEAIPKEEVRQFIENIQKIKDNHNEHGEPINYGTICGILIEGHRLLDKYKESKDGNNN